MIAIGPYRIESQAILAPMAGITDQPFRRLCRRLGAGMAVSEMVTSDPGLWNSRKSRFRMNHTGEAEPRSVQIAGNDPEMLALAAQLNVQRGAQVIDINMGCPAKKVCNKAAGSALLKNEQLVEKILHRVVQAVDVPVTLKIRTGWDTSQRNGLQIAKIAQSCGIQALAVHGRTRACGYKGNAEYETIAAIKSSVTIPVFANGDIDSPEKARRVLNLTGADAVMIGRAAQGRPWIFREINHFLSTGEQLLTPTNHEIRTLLLDHLQELHEFYGATMGVFIARKHVGWYLAAMNSGQRDDFNPLENPSKSVDRNIENSFRKAFNQLETTDEQLAAINRHFDQLPASQRTA